MVSAALALLNNHPSVAVDLAMRFSKNCNFPGSLVSSNSFFPAAYILQGQVVCMDQGHTHTHTRRKSIMAASTHKHTLGDTFDIIDSFWVSTCRRDYKIISVYRSLCILYTYLVCV